MVQEKLLGNREVYIEGEVGVLKFMLPLMCSAALGRLAIGELELAVAIHPLVECLV
eukprot:SAG22_NODE_509_length_9598_cov_12.010001_2_plen_56_part_00